MFYVHLMLLYRDPEIGDWYLLFFMKWNNTVNFFALYISFIVISSSVTYPVLNYTEILVKRILVFY